MNLIEPYHSKPLRPFQLRVILFIAGGVGILAMLCSTGVSATSLPQFSRDTVLVWSVIVADLQSKFVVRIAEFLPNRFIEWENATTQGTIYMSGKAVNEAGKFINSSLFEGGVDKSRKDATTLWLSQRIFKELKDNGKAKLDIDSVRGWMSVEGSDRMVIDVNRTPTPLPVLKVKDNRGMERWFLDAEENPLLVKHSFRSFDQTLQSITTNRANTLRWIRGKKLNQPH